METIDQIRLAKQAKKSINTATSDEKNKALRAMAAALVDATADILAANQLDMEAARGRISEVMLDRLLLTEERIQAMADGILQVAARSSGRTLRGADPGERFGHSEETSGHGGYWDYL